MSSYKQSSDPPAVAAAGAEATAAGDPTAEPMESGDSQPLAGRVTDARAAEAAFNKLQFIGLLLFALLFYTGVIGIALANNQYIYARYAADAGIPDAVRSSDSSRCKGHSNSTEELRRKAAIAQQRSSQLGLYSSLVSGIPSLFSVFFLSAFSDRWGRKVSMLIPWITTFLAFLLISLVVLLDLALEWTLLANFISGLGGSFASMLAAVFATVADITNTSNRAMYIGIAEATLTICFSVAEVSIGIWIRLRGFKEPVVAFSLLVAASLAPYLLLVPETAPAAARNASGQPLTRQRCLSLLVGSFDLFSRDWRRARKLFSLVGAFLFFSLSSLAFGVITLYLLGLPFCWNSEKLGYYLAAGSVIDQVSFVTVLALLRSRVTDSFLAFIGLGSDAMRQVVVGIAFLFAPPFDDIMLYIARGVGLLSKLPSTMLRAIMSKSVSADEQGAAFGVVAFVQVLSSLLAGVSSTGIYAATVATLPGFVFFVLAVYILLSSVCVVMYSQFNRIQQRQDAALEVKLSEAEPEINT